MNNTTPEREPSLDSLSEDQRILLELCALEQYAFEKVPGKDADGNDVVSTVADLLNPANPTCAPMLERLEPEEIGRIIRERLNPVKPQG